MARPSNATSTSGPVLRVAFSAFSFLPFEPPPLRPIERAFVRAALRAKTPTLLLPLPGCSPANMRFISALASGIDANPASGFRGQRRQREGQNIHFWQSLPAHTRQSLSFSPACICLENDAVDKTARRPCMQREGVQCEKTVADTEQPIAAPAWPLYGTRPPLRDLCVLRTVRAAGRGFRAGTGHSAGRCTLGRLFGLRDAARPRN